MATDVETEAVDAGDNHEDDVTTESIDAATQRKIDHYFEIRRLNANVCSVRTNYLSCKSVASEVKKQYDNLVDELEQLILRGPDPQIGLPFGECEGDDDQVENNDAWRETPIVDALSLTPSQYSKLEEAGATTIGDLEDLRAGDGLASIKGFGQAAVDRIEDEVINWLASLQDDNQDETGDDTDEPDDGEILEDL